MNSTDKRAPFLIMAHHRSGSNFLHDLLQSHPQIECINEPLSMHTRFFRQCDLVRWTQADYDPVCLHVALARHGELRSYLGDMREYLLQSNVRRIIGFKETALFGKLEWLKEYLPSLKIIFLERDPRAIVSSVLRSGLIDFWRYRDLVPKAFREIFTDYRGSNASHDASVVETQIAAMSVVTRYELARRTLPLFEHRVVSLQGAMRDTATCLRSLTDFLGLDPHPAQLSFLRKRQGASRGGAFSSFRAPQDVENNWRTHLSARQIEVIDDVLFAAQCHGAADVTA